MNVHEPQPANVGFVLSLLTGAAGVQASVVECDGHELFRESGNAQAVVVLIGECTGLSCHLPMPGELASSLRGQRSLEELGGH